ncbi:MAG: hypothetical protein FJ261_08385 [Planctomycetes bacterium]|nr:hypothetical protein [Planctomycetota bacterium]
MQPDKKHRRSIKGKKGRARLFLKAHLGWLRGWPVQADDGSLRWMRLIVNENDECVITETPVDSVLLRQAETTLSRLVKEHPEQIPAISKGAKDWPERTKAMIEALKDAWTGKITASAALGEIVSAWLRREQALMKRMAREHPSQFWIAELLAWRNNLTANRMTVLAPWLADNLKAVGAMVRHAGKENGIKLAILLTVLVDTGEAESAAYWLDILSHAKSWHTPLLNARAECREVINQLTSARRQWKGRLRWDGWKPDCHTTVAAYLERLLWNLPDRKKDFEGLTLLASTLFNREAVDKAEAIGKLLWTNLAEALKWLLGKDRKGLWPEEAEALEKCLKSAHELHNSLPDMSFRQVADGFEMIRNQTLFDDWKKLSGFLSSLPVEMDGDFPRHHAWNFLAKIITLRNARLVEAAFQFLEGTGSEGILKFISSIILGFWRLDWWLIEMAETSMVSPGTRIRTEDYRRWFEAVRLVAVRVPRVLSSHGACINIGYLSFHIHDMDALVESGVSLVRQDWFRKTQMIELFQMAFKLGALGVDPVAMLGAIAGHYAAQPNFEHPREFSSRLNQLIDCLRSSNRISDIGFLLKGTPDIARLRSLALKSSAFLAITGPGAVIHRQAFPDFDWPERYPREFLPLLERIATLSANARSLVGNILDTDFPDRNLIADEVANLAARIGTTREAPGMAERLANLEAVLARGPKKPSARRLKNLGDKLEACVGRNAPATLESDLSTAVLKAVGFNDREPLPRFQDIAIDILMAILGVKDPGQRELGIALWKEGLKAGPWASMQDHPANKAFVKRMKDIGLRMDPWLAPPPPSDMPTANGKIFRLGITLDPFDILMMGEHFQSCLSLHGGNFYSTITNAVDINKRVIYARDPAGKVAGRCLLALTDQGRIQTFHPYCHDGKAEFDKLANAFASDLAARMGTTTSQKGDVSTLVAARWYDDGPEDLSHRFDFTHEGSVFRTVVPTVSPEGFARLLAEAVHPLGIDHEVIMRTYVIDEVQARPELVEQLASMLDSCRDVPLDTWTLFAAKAIAGGLRDTALAIVDNHFPKGMEGWLRWFKPRFYEADALAIIGLIGEGKPSMALRLIRATRESSITDDDKEYNDQRRRVLAAIHRRLGRHALADQLA